MASSTRRFLGQSVPWRANIPWWVPMAEGIFTCVLGVFLVFWTEESGRVIQWAIGGFLLVNSIIWILSGLRAEASRARLVRGGIGLIVGLLVVIQPFTEYMTVETALIVLAVGLVATGLIGLFDALWHRAGGWGSVIFATLTLAVGGLLIYQMISGVSVVSWIGYICIALGVLLLGYAFALYKRRRQSPGTTSAPQAS
jgi:uncharacterized membrane protein HdeD (DUF308 family)